MEQVAITREVSPDMGACELSFVDREPIDVARARRQHAAYQQVLRELGCQVVSLPAEPELPDAVFVEDTALVLDEVAVMTRPGAASRLAEVPSIQAALARRRPLLSIQAPGTLEGGDILRDGKRIFVGESARSNPEGIRQLANLLAPFGYTVRGVAIQGCLHLKSAVTLVADGTVLLNADWVDASAFGDYRIIPIDPGEPHAANALRAGTGVLYPDCFPRTQAALQAAGIAVSTVDVSELQKAEGAVTCCSLVFTG